MILFHQPYFDTKCLEYIGDTTTHQSGDGKYTQLVTTFFQSRYGFQWSMLTPSCTHSLEMMAMILHISSGDEVIIPSFTFVSTANAFVKFGATVVMADCDPEHPTMDIELIPSLVTPRTRAVCIVHYAGTSCDMDRLVTLCQKYNLILLEDAAQAIHSFDSKGRPLGSFGAMSAFSFHETKNIHCGEGGLLVVNDATLLDIAYVIRDKGTNRRDMKFGASHYEWVALGSSYLLSDILAAYLYAQLVEIDHISTHRRELWMTYEKFLQQRHPIGNGHIYFILCKSASTMKELLLQKGITTATHYFPLHLSRFYRTQFSSTLSLPYAEFFHNHLLRLPLYHTLTIDQVQHICHIILEIHRDTDQLLNYTPLMK